MSQLLRLQVFNCFPFVEEFNIWSVTWEAGSFLNETRARKSLLRLHPVQHKSEIAFTQRRTQLPVASDPTSYTLPMQEGEKSNTLRSMANLCFKQAFNIPCRDMHGLISIIFLSKDYTPFKFN